jgi:hypothetical protein
MKLEKMKLGTGWEFGFILCSWSISLVLGPRFYILSWGK